MGDILKFGESTRLYVVNGPESQGLGEHDSANMQAYRAHLVEKSKKIAETQNEGVSWGFREDAVNEDYDDEETYDKDEKELPDYIRKDEHYDRKYGEKFSSTLNDDDVSDKDKKLLEKVRKHERKIQNMQEEISKIYMKEGKQDEGLTAGQTAAVERNDKRIEVLKAELISLEAQIRGKQEQRIATSSDSSATKTGRRQKRDDDDSEGALDTTAETADVSTNWRLKKKLKKDGGTGITGVNGGSSTGDALTYDGLKSEWDSKNTIVEGLEREMTKMRDILEECSRRSAAQRMDDLDAYMVESQKKEAETKLKQLTSEVEVGKAVLQRLNRLMKVAAPALLSLHSRQQDINAPAKDTSSVAMNNSSINSRLDVADQVTSDETDDGFISRESFFKNRSSLDKVSDARNERVPAVLPNNQEEEIVDSDNSESVKRKREEQCEVSTNSTSKVGIGPHINPTEIQDKLQDQEPNAAGLTKGPHPGPHPTTVEPTELPPTQTKPPAGPKLPEGPRRKKPNVPVPAPSVDISGASFTSNTLEGGEAVWCPPKNQTGDGKTSLNAKYGY